MTMSLLVMLANFVRGFFDLPERVRIFLRRTSIYRSSCEEPVVAFVRSSRTDSWRCC